MRVIVVSYEPYLSQFLKITNKNLDIVAIVMPILKLFNGEKINFNDGRISEIYSYIYLKECLKDKYYDYLIVAIPPGKEEDILLDDLKAMNFDKRKLFRIGGIFLPHALNLIHLFYSINENNISDYKILLTGMSHALYSTDLNCYDLPVLNCTMASQDLYYDYLFAKNIFNVKNSSFKYAVIGLTLFSFHYDESYPGGGLEEE